MSTSTTGLEIAIVGMAGRFPGAPDVATFWRHLLAGKEGITFFTPDDLAAAGTPEELIADPDFVAANGYLEGAELFDADFFGLSPRDAELLDPQQRLFLECAWHALEAAGHDPRRAEGPIGVYAGTSVSTYLSNNLMSHPEILASAGVEPLLIANDKDFLASRVCYKLGLEGPGVSVQTACSSSLVAVHMACQGLLAGECDLALAGGVSVTFPQKAGYLYHQGGILSPDGHCRPFDATARGSVGGEGVAIVVLGRLADALERGDTIHAVIKGSAINNDGGDKAGFTAPRVAGQAKVVRAAQLMAEVDPASIAFVETHGTATELGDPIEVAALTEVFADPERPPHSCALGAVKSNIGHLDAAAGIAGLVKAALAVEHGELPPTLHFENPNPAIDFAAGPFYVVAERSPWPVGSGPRRAAVSSFGIGGTNAHVILEEPPPAAPSEVRRRLQLVPLSARAPAALDTLMGSFAEYLASPSVSLPDVAWTLQIGRRRLEHRRFVLAESCAEAASLFAGKPGDRMWSGEQPSDPAQVAFIFAGLGDQYVGMAIELYREETVFRRELDRCAEILDPLLGEDIRRILYPPGRQENAVTTADAGAALTGTGPDLKAMLRRGGEKDAALEDPEERHLRSTRRLQPLLFALEWALARMWISWGIEPRALLGYSLGEYAAAAVAGVMSLEHALRLVARRAELIDALPAGGMMAVALPEAELRPYLSSGLDLSAVNGPEMCVVAGLDKALDPMAERLREEGHTCRRIETSHAFHSRQMEPIADDLRRLLAGLELRPPQIPYISNATGTWITPEEATDPEYWVRHLCQPVRFSDGVRELWSEPGRVLLEIGPGQSLGSIALQQSERPRPVLASLPYRHDRQASDRFALETLGRLWLLGVDVDFAAFHEGERLRRVPLPLYPFEGKRFFIEPQRAGRDAPRRAPAEESRITAMEDWFHLPSVRLAGPAPGWEGTTHAVLLDDGHAGGDHGRFVEALADALAARGADVMRSPQPADVAALGELLEGAKTDVPVHLVHLAGCAPAGTPDQAEEQSFYGPLDLARILAEAAPESLRLTFVTRRGLAVGGSETPLPERALLAGIVGSLPREIPAIRCRWLDLAPEPDEEAAREADRLARELLGGSESRMALRNADRWLPCYEPHPLPAPRRSPFSEGSVVLITGGLGGIALGLAEELARRHKARLVLVGRRPLDAAADDRRTAAVERIRRLGAEVLLLTADVTDRTQMETAAREVGDRFGRLDAVFHTAGVPGGGLMQLKRREEAARVLAPKVEGTRVLCETLAPLEPAATVLFSSLVAVTGALGQSDYGAANAFLGAFAETAKLAAGGRVLAVDWCEWRWDAWGQEALAQLDEQTAAHARAERERYGLDFAEGFEVISRALAADLPRVAVSTRNLAAQIAAEADLSQVLEGLEEARKAGGRHPRPTSLGVDYAAPSDPVEERLADLWQELLGIEPIGVHDNFFQLGGHSLLGTQLIARVREGLGADLPLSALFEAPTVRGLGQLIRDQETAEVEGPIERLDEIERLDGRTGAGEGAKAPLERIDDLTEGEMDDLLEHLLVEERSE